MTPEELVERVALAIADAYYRSASNGQLTLHDTDTIPEDWAAEALAAIAVLRPVLRAVALEEAARVCDKIASDPRMYSAERRRGSGQCSAAIRAMIPNGKISSDNAE